MVGNEGPDALETTVVLLRRGRLFKRLAEEMKEPMNRVGRQLKPGLKHFTLFTKREPSQGRTA